MGKVMQDVRYGLRMLVKSPGFTLVAVLALAFGIGGNSAMFSYVNAWVLHPLPYPHGERLIVLLSQNTKTGGTGNSISPGDFYDFQRQVSDFEDLCAWSPTSFNLTGSGAPERVDGNRVTWNFFQTLGAAPALGRAFLAPEDQPGAAHVAIISSGLWETRFAGDPHILGRQIQINGESYSVVGVMPAKFQLPLAGISNIWVPLALSAQDRADRKSDWLLSIARLRPGVTLMEARAEVSGVASQLEKTYPATNSDSGIVLHTLEYEIGQNQGNEEVLICFWIVALVLLMACANVANLLLARATGRTKELAVRTALGARRWRLIRQLVTETVLLFVGGSLAGVGVAYATLAWIGAAIPPRIRGYLVNYGQVNLDYQTFFYTLAVALAAGLLFGLAPAISSSKLEVYSMLKEASGRASSDRRGSRLRSVFVVGEIALAVVILVCSALLAKSFLGLIRANPGFQPNRVTAAQLDLPETKYKSPAEIRNFYQQVIDRLRALPQTEAVGASHFIPFGECCSSVEIYAPDKPAPKPGQAPGALYSQVTPDYFSVMQIALVKGRYFTSADQSDAPSVLVINQALANYFWPHEDPLGRKIRFTSDREITATIVGIVQDVKMYNSTSVKHSREMYSPFAQLPARSMGIVVRSRADQSALSNAIRSAIWAVDADQPVSTVRQIQAMMDEQYSGYRIVTELMGFFSVLALFLGAIGIYAVMAFNVTQRRHEIGIRVALGAQPWKILGLVLKSGAWLTGLGVAIGGIAALAASRLLNSVLFGVSATDPLAFAGGALVLVVAALAACYIPARRALGVDPITALRHE